MPKKPLTPEEHLNQKPAAETTSSSKGKSARSAVILLMALSAFTKVFGFIRDILLGRFFGIGETAEAYKIAQTIPMIILMMVGTGISTGFIPTFNRTQMKKGRDQAHRFLANTTNVTILIGIVFSLIVTLYPGFFVKLFASGFTGSKLELTKQFTRIAVWGVVFSFMSYLLQPYLQIHDNFWVPALVGIPMNLVFYLSYPAAKYLNPLFLPIGIVLSVLVQVLWMLPFARRLGYRWQPVIDFQDRELQHLLALAAPVVLGVAVNQINVVVDKTMASRLLDGGVASLDYASKMNGFVQGIFVYSIIAVIYPKISKLFYQKDLKGVEDMTTNSMVTMALVVIPCVMGLMVLSHQIIYLLFFGGEFDERAVNLTGGAMFYYAPGLIGYAFREIFSRIFYSMSDSRTPMITAAIAVGINVVLNLLLSSFMGINGLALATSISSLISAGLLVIILRWRGEISLQYRSMAGKLLKISFASLVMGATAWFSFHQLEAMAGTKLGVMASILLSAVVYGLLILCLKIPEVDQIVQAVWKKIRRA